MLKERNILFANCSFYLSLGWTGFDSSEAGFKELWQLYQYVKENVDPDAIVIDAADMISEPCKV